MLYIQNIFIIFGTSLTLTVFTLILVFLYQNNFCDLSLFSCIFLSVSLAFLFVYLFV